MAGAKRATSKDVAELAGVSRTTVSFVLNRSPRVQISEDTRRRVWAAAYELGYYPDAAARSLARRATGHVGVLLCQRADLLFQDAFLMQVLSGIHQVIRPQGYHILLEAVEDVTAPDAYIGLVRARHVDGLVVVGPRTDDTQLALLEREAFPAVLLGRLPTSGLCQVDVDNERGAQVAVQHLVALGHRRIAFISNGPLLYTASRDRLQGYLSALAAAGLAPDEDLVRYGDFTRASGRTAMRALLSLPEPPTAVFVASDVVALGVLAELRAAGQRVPDDVAIVGFDDLPVAAETAPPLTSLHLPAGALGQTAAQALLAQMAAGQQVRERLVLLETNLVVRASSGPPRASSGAS